MAPEFSWRALNLFHMMLEVYLGWTGCLLASCPHGGILPMSISPSFLSIKVTVSFAAHTCCRLTVNTAIDSTHQFKCVNAVGSEWPLSTAKGSSVAFLRGEDNSCTWSPRPGTVSMQCRCFICLYLKLKWGEVRTEICTLLSEVPPGTRKWKQWAWFSLEKHVPKEWFVGLWAYLKFYGKNWSTALGNYLKQFFSKCSSYP